MRSIRQSSKSAGQAITGSQLPVPIPYFQDWLPITFRQRINICTTDYIQAITKKPIVSSLSSLTIGLSEKDFFLIRIPHYAVYAGTGLHRGCSPYRSRTTAGVRNQDRSLSAGSFRTCGYPSTTTYPSSVYSVP